MAYLKKLVAKTETTLDDAIIEISEKPLSLLIILSVLCCAE